MKLLFLNFIQNLSTKSEQELQMAKRPLSAYGLNRAMTTFSKNAAQTLNPRFQVNNVHSSSTYQNIENNENEIKILIQFKGENILFLELDMPNRTTRDYESPTLAPHLQAALDTALKDEDDIEVDEP